MTKTKWYNSIVLEYMYLVIQYYTTDYNIVYTHDCISLRESVVYNEHFFFSYLNTFA